MKFTSTLTLLRSTILRSTILLIAGAFCMQQVSAQCAASTGATAGTVFFNTAVSGGIAWTQPQNAGASDGVYSTAGVTVGLLATVPTNYLTATGFGFAIPAGATICGVTVTVKRAQTDLVLLGTITDNSVKLVVGGTIGGTEHATASNWSATPETITYGGTTDTWGSILTPAVVNNANFGVAISADLHEVVGLATEGGIDYITVNVAYSVTVLPINLTGFTAQAQNNTNVLNWTATDNTAGDVFIVQRSGDSKNWDDLTTMAAETTAMGQSYSYTDVSPLSGNNFYRLALKQPSGQVVYSAIQVVNQAVTSVRCYPNPFVDAINISGPSPIHSVILRDLSGRTIYSKSNTSGGNTLQIPASGLPAGMYLVTVDGTSFKISKQ